VCVRPSTETTSFHFGNARREAIIWNCARDIRETAFMTAHYKVKFHEITITVVSDSLQGD
jgi:hypothetical protein